MVKRVKPEITPISRIEKQIRTFVKNFMRIGIKPRVLHEKEYRSIVVIVPYEEIVNALRRKVPYTNVTFRNAENHIIIVVKY